MLPLFITIALPGGHFELLWTIVHYSKKIEQIEGGLYYRTGSLPLNSLESELWMTISFRAPRRIKQHKVYLGDLADSWAVICLCLLFCLVLLFGEKTEGRRISEASPASDWLWADTGSETRSQSADGIEGIQTEAAWLQGAGMGLTDRRTNKWTTSVRSGPSPGLLSAPRPDGKYFCSAPSRLISSD